MKIHTPYMLFKRDNLLFHSLLLKEYVRMYYFAAFFTDRLSYVHLRAKVLSFYPDILFHEVLTAGHIRCDPPINRSFSKISIIV